MNLPAIPAIAATAAFPRKNRGQGPLLTNGVATRPKKDSEEPVKTKEKDEQVGDEERNEEKLCLFVGWLVGLFVCFLFFKHVFFVCFG